MATWFLVMPLLAFAYSASVMSPPETKEGLKLARRQGGCNGDPSVLAKQCLEPLQEEQHLGADMDFLDVDTPEAVDRVCNDLVQAKACVANVYHSCNGRPDLLTDITVKTTFGVAGYMCSNQGRRLIISEIDCWDKQEFEDTFDRCIEDQQDFVNAGDACSHVQELRKCVKRGVRQVCNRQAAKFTDKVLYYSLQPIARHLFDCDISLRLTRSLFRRMTMKRSPLP